MIPVFRLIADGGLVAFSLNCAVAFVILVCGFTFLFTTWRFWTSLKGTRVGREPPTVPYYLPWVGSGLDVARNPHAFLKSAMARSTNNRPLRARVGSYHMYIIAGVQNVQTVFRNSHELDAEWFELIFTDKLFTMPKKDMRRLGEDTSGIAAVPAMQEKASKRGRIWKEIRDIYHTTIEGNQQVSGMIDRWIPLFVSTIEASLGMKPRSEWITIPIYKFVRAHMFMATTTVLAGPRLLEGSLTLNEDFWEFDEAVYQLIYSGDASRFLCRRGWVARNRLLTATTRYLASAWKDRDGWSGKETQDMEWEPSFGHRMLRLREEALEAYGVSLEGRASMEFGFIWAASTNTSPAVGWMLIEILRDCDLHRRACEEARTAFVADELTGMMHLNHSRLASLRLLNSIFLECLRLRASVPVTRRIRSDMDVDGYTLRAGNFVFIPSFLVHYDENLWSSPEHPADSFWAERFLCSGDTNVSMPKSVIPFGGGLNLCPGRNFAKQAILATVAIMLVKFDLECVGDTDKDGFNIETHQPSGVLKPQPDLLVRMRRVGE